MTETLIRSAAEQLIETHPLLGSSVDEVVDALRGCELKRYPAGHVLCAEGDAGDELFVLLSGSVSVNKNDHLGQSRALAVLSPPAMFGHMALVDGSRRSATCVVDDNAWLARLDRLSYDRLLSGPSPIGRTWRRLLLSSLARQLHRGNRRLNALLLPPPPKAPVSTMDVTVDDGPDDVQEDQLLKIAGVLDGWDMDTSVLSDTIEYVEDEDMKRTREARQKLR